MRQNNFLSENHPKNYRPDVDGLRAIAVSGVVVYHMETLDFLPGGFLGVDIFFVISGFLITSLIMREVRAGTFSFRDFYSRRARRLLPAFIFVVLSTAALAWVLLLPTQMLELTHSMFFALFGTSNMYFMLADPYWAESAKTLPFLHTWSLGVEEQFYLVFPTLLVLTTRFLTKNWRLFIFLSIAVMSLALAYWVNTINEAFSFYLFPTRAWELLAGAILALMFDLWKIRVSRVLGSLLGAAGLILITVSYMYLGNFITAPGLLTAVPVCGAALIISAGFAPNPVSKFLGSKQLARLGILSYGIYLWHYPLLVLGGITVPLTFIDELVLVLVAIAMAVLSYFCVENPFRAHSLLKEAKLFTSFGFLTALAFVFGSITSSGYAEPRSGVPWPEWPQESSEYWQVTQTDGNIGQVILMGDSHMAMLAESATGHTERLGLNFIDATAGGCPVFTGVTRTGTDCDALFQADRLTRASRAGPSFVILGGRYPLALENSRFDNQEGGVEPGSAVNYVPTNEFNFVDTNRESILREALIGALEELLRQGHTIVLVYPIPEVGWDVPQEIGNRARLSQAGSITGFPVSQWFQQRLLPGIEAWPLEKPVTTSYTKYQERTESTFDALDSITSERIIRVFPHHLFCETKEVGRCTTHDEKDIFYADDDHLSLSGANLVSDEIFAKITEIIPR